MAQKLSHIEFCFIEKIAAKCYICRDNLRFKIISQIISVSFIKYIYEFSVCLKEVPLKEFENSKYFLPL